MQIKAVTGNVNTPESVIVDHARANIRRQLPQVRPYQPQGTPIALIGGGPSLLTTVDELRADVFRGCKVATVNGAHEWAIQQNIKPDLAIVLDARAGNADFVKTPVPGCKYLVASQCHPDVFDRLEGRSVYLYHALSYEEAETPILERYYTPTHFAPVVGGSTVTLRALTILHMLGFRRMDLYGFDSCWMGASHHGYPQALNDTDKRIPVRVKVDGVQEAHFLCAPWHLRQLEDFQLWVKELGHLVSLHVHGEGLIAYMMKTGARLVKEDAAEVAVG